VAAVPVAHQGLDLAPLGENVAPDQQALEELGGRHHHERGAAGGDHAIVIDLEDDAHALVHRLVAHVLRRRA
jgi:hypothetical protein